MTSTYPFQAITRVENDRWQDDVEEDLGIERRLQVNFVDVSLQLTPKRVSICVVLRRG